MSVGHAVRLMAGHSMRGYFIALIGGAMLVASAFLPWLFLGEVGIGGVPDAAGLWVLGLGVTAILLASLSIYTRKNSRHPLLVVGLASCGILFLAYEWMERAAVEQAWARSQALAIVDHVAAADAPPTVAGLGVYLGAAGASVLVLFGLTIVVRRVATPYAAPDDDDV
jgi:hypothetical protein